MIYYKKLKECEENLDIFKDKLDHLSYQLDATIKTIRLINQDLAADRQAEDAYNSEREADRYMEQREIERLKFVSNLSKFCGINPDYEQAKADQETIADDILKAAGIDYKGEKND